MTGEHFPPGVMWLEDEAGQLVQAKTPLIKPNRFAELIKSAQASGLVPDLAWSTLPQQSTLKAFTRAFDTAGRAAGKMAAMLGILNKCAGLRDVRPVPPVVPAGLSRVDSARRRSNRSALLRERRRALRHNRRHQLPRSRTRIFISDPKVLPDGGKAASFRDRREDRLDAVRFAFATTSRKD